MRLPNSRFKILLIAVGFELGMVVPGFGLGYFLGLRPFEAWNWNLRDVVRGVLASAPMLLFFMILLRSRFEALAKIREFLDRVIYPLLGACSAWELALISLCAGVGEEVLFREIIQQALSSHFGSLVGIAGASVLFGLAHLITPTYAIVTAVIGVYLGLWFDLTGNLLIPVVTHAFYDFVALLILFRRKRYQ
jgi:membrane protease YdiL (CAAX protease family)